MPRGVGVMDNTEVYSEIFSRILIRQLVGIKTVQILMLQKI